MCLTRDTREKSRVIELFPIPHVIDCKKVYRNNRDMP